MATQQVVGGSVPVKPKVKKAPPAPTLETMARLKTRVDLAELVGERPPTAVEAAEFEEFARSIGLNTSPAPAPRSHALSFRLPPRGPVAPVTPVTIVTPTVRLQPHPVAVRPMTVLTVTTRKRRMRQHRARFRVLIASIPAALLAILVMAQQLGAGTTAPVHPVMPNPVPTVAPPAGGPAAPAGNTNTSQVKAPSGGAKTGGTTSSSTGSNIKSGSGTNAAPKTGTTNRFAPANLAPPTVGTIAPVAPAPVPAPVVAPPVVRASPTPAPTASSPSPPPTGGTGGTTTPGISNSGTTDQTICGGTSTAPNNPDGSTSCTTDGSAGGI